MFVSGYVKTHFETVAYSAATGARLWAKAYQPGGYISPRAITVSPDGARVYVTGAGTAGRPPTWAMATVAYDVGTGRQVWARGSMPDRGTGASALAVSPDGTTLYVTGDTLGPGRSGWELAVIAYAAATGRQRWLRHYSTKAGPGSGASVAVSQDGKTVYATGTAGSDALTVAYRAAGTLKWAALYKDPEADFVTGSQVVAGPGGGSVYVVGRVSDKHGHIDIVTFAYHAATGQRTWLARCRGGSPAIGVTPDGRTVIIAGPWEPGGYAMAAYNASTGRIRWTRLAPDKHMFPDGLVIDPHGDTVFIGGNRIAAYSVADGTVLWTTRYAHGSGIIGLSRDGTRLFGTRWRSGGIITVAYQA